MGRGLLCAAAVTAVATLAGTASAASGGGATRTTIDGAMAVGYDKARGVGVVAVTARYTTTSVRATLAGPRSYSEDLLVTCLAYGTRTGAETGCTITAPRPVTTGTVLPGGAEIRARVPVTTRRGGWIETHLSLTATGDPYRVGGAAPSTATTDLLGVAVPTGVSVTGGTTLARAATFTGTIRTDRRNSAARPVSTSSPFNLVLRYDIASAGGSVDPDDVTAALRAAAAGALPR